MSPHSDGVLKHEQRIEIAKDFAEKVVKKYGKNIVTVAIAGPVAEDHDRDFSDLDLVIVTRKPLMQPYHFTFKDCIVEPTYICESDLRKVALTPLGIHGGPMEKAYVTYLNDRNWLRWAYLFATSKKVLYGSDSPIKRFNKLAASISKERCKKQARHELPYLRASINHIRGGSAKSRHVVEFINLAYEIVAMLNATCYRTHSQFEESKEFKVLPKGFHDLINKIQSATTPEELDKNMMELNENTLLTCQENRAGLEFYDSLPKMKA